MWDAQRELAQPVPPPWHPPAGGCLNRGCIAFPRLLPAPGTHSGGWQPPPLQGPGPPAWGVKWPRAPVAFAATECPLVGPGREHFGGGKCPQPCPGEGQRAVGTQVRPRHLDWPPPPPYLVQDPGHPVKQHLEEVALVKCHFEVVGVKGPGGQGPPPWGCAGTACLDLAGVWGGDGG